MTFRHYNPDDRVACQALLISNVGPYFSPNEIGDIGSQLDFMDEQALGKADVEEEVVFWVGEWEGRVVATGGLESIDGAAFLCWGAVHLDEQGRGFGSLLLRHRLAHVVREWPEVGSVFCDTSARTEGFYARYGFVPKYRQAAHWGGELDLVVMELSLDGVERFPNRMRPDGSIGFRLIPPCPRRSLS